MAKVIRKVTFGLLTPTAKCGCEKRKHWLNRAGEAANDVVRRFCERYNLRRR